MEEEDVGLVFHAEKERGCVTNVELCLLDRFLTNCPIRANIMKEHMASNWRRGKGVSIKEVEQGLFIF